MIFNKTGVKISPIKKLLGIVAVGHILLSACGGGNDPEPTLEDQTSIDKALIEAYLTENNITATEDGSGIFYYPVVENPTGALQQVKGSILSIYYSAKVLNGQVIDEILLSQNEDPYKLKQGVNSIVPVGLDIGLAFMKEGETYTFLIPSGLAYGELTFSTLIPANSVIEIEVELVLIENEQDQQDIEETLINDYIADKELDDLVKNPTDKVELLPSGVYYKRISEGNEDEVAIKGEQISTTYIASFLDDAVFDRTSGNDTFDFNFDSKVVMDGLDLGIAEMEKGERALLIIPSAQAYQQSVGVIPSYLSDELVELQVIPEYASKVAPYKVLVFDITLL
ncbi:FKBP-type peptidyl-prolyl cis-trans isomerase [Reichenbachiella sp. MALMAid0571]|uniref:FKBP-type peptidyl-prolyl cis-trans isomerase n=1 Tax=Reichenbachiella sp. MALMAid0571 TaxID=3143939 RepID=UPI0032DF7886